MCANFVRSAAYTRRRIHIGGFLLIFFFALLGGVCFKKYGIGRKGILEGRNFGKIVGKLTTVIFRKKWKARTND